MFNSIALTALVAIMSATHLANALPQAASTATGPYPNTILATWVKNDYLCRTDASVDDCKKAAAEICASPNLKVDHEATVGKCKVIYMYDIANTVPTAEICTAAYTQILTAGIGGILGYSAVGSRTSDPLYGVWPVRTSGGGSCFVKPGDKYDVSRQNGLPNGQIPENCGAQQWDTENRTSSLPDCNVNTLEMTVRPTCLTAIATSYYTGPFSTTDGLSCFGDSAQQAFKTFQVCFANKAAPPNAPPSTNIRPDNSILLPNPPKDVCRNLEDGYKFSCLEQDNSYRKAFHCKERPRTEQYPNELPDLGVFTDANGVQRNRRPGQEAVPDTAKPAQRGGGTINS